MQGFKKSYYYYYHCREIQTKPIHASSSSCGGALRRSSAGVGWACPTCIYVAIQLHFSVRVLGRF